MGLSIGGGPRVTVIGSLSEARRNEKKKAYAGTCGVKKNDSVTVCCLPKGQRGKLCGFSYTPATVKAQRLQRESAGLTARIATTQHSNLPAEEKGRKLRRLRCQRYYVDRQLNLEMQAAPRVHVFIDEEE